MSENFAYNTYYSYSKHKINVLYQFILRLNRKMLRDGKEKHGKNILQLQM